MTYISKRLAIAAVAALTDSKAVASFRKNIAGVFMQSGPPRYWTEWASMSMVERLVLEGAYWEQHFDPNRFVSESPF